MGVYGGDIMKKEKIEEKNEKADKISIEINLSAIEDIDDFIFKNEVIKLHSER